MRFLIHLVQMALLIVILKKQRFDKSLIISSLCHEVASVRLSGIASEESSQSSVEEFSSSSINSIACSDYGNSNQILGFSLKQSLDHQN